MQSKLQQPHMHIPCLPLLNVVFQLPNIFHTIKRRDVRRKMTITTPWNLSMNNYFEITKSNKLYNYFETERAIGNGYLIFATT